MWFSLKTQHKIILKNPQALKFVPGFDLPTYLNETII